ncbi:MAG TPA: PQQ-binding-like beta-propeller repeat protein [bacterium]|nr:PQQ-binding-like beta-propeller repeat protein [bacterium]
MRRTVIITGIVIAALASAVSLAGEPIWQMMMHDCRHTCQSKFNGPSRANIAWRTLSDQLLSGPVVVAEDGAIYAVAFPNGLFALDNSGALKWSQDCNLPSSVALGNDGTVYVPCGALHAFSSRGELKWRGPGVQNITVGPDGTIYACTVSSFCALSTEGDVKWEYYTDGRKVREPAVAPNGNVYVLEDYWSLEDGRLLALDSKGNLLWEQAVSGFEVSDLLAASDSSVIFYSLSQGILYCYGPNGELNWSFSTGMSFVPYDEAVAGDPCLGTSEEGTIYLLADKPWYVSTPNPPYESLFFALTSAGDLKWSLEIPGSPGNNIAIGANGTIYVGAIAGGTSDTLFSFQPDGTENWRTEIGGASEPVIGGEGVLYISGWGLTAIADYGSMYIDLFLAQSWFYPGDSLSLTVAGENMGRSTDVDFYLVMWDIDGNIYSWPTWQPGVSPGLTDFHIPYGTRWTLESFAELTLPTDSPPINRQARFWFAVALTKPQTMEFLCSADMENINFVTNWRP